MESDTEGLRTAAPRWNLAGDKQLLGVLQGIHERLISKCQEANRTLDEMAAALDDASIDLQNVNNKFMALSNTQFIESRVYDDDVEIKQPETIKESPKTDPSTEIDKIKHGLKVLEDMHEPLHIIHDSDSDCDTEDEDASRLILKPKDPYAHRPLPYIIGSYSWQYKWHAGLQPSDSDSDSLVTKSHSREEYSDSEPESTNVQTDKIHVPDATQVSTTSSDMVSEQELPTPSPVKQTPADVAAELARRLGGNVTKIPEPETEYVAPNPVTRKVYKPEKPATSTIFSDEPPPLDQSYSDEYSQEEDIFAELHKNKPYSDNRDQNVTDDLFGGLNKKQPKDSKDDIFSDFREPPKPTVQKSTLFSDESEPELFAVKPEPKTADVPEISVKKPVGGISLFGNKGTESIGAAILKRNQRQSSEEDTNDDHRQEAKKEKDIIKKEKDIFDDLFAKSEKEQRDKDKIEVTKKVEKVTKKVDIFSDNLFDDIDDIFTTNVPKTKENKSIFEDEDELFSNIAVNKTNEVKNKNIFDSDDDLFIKKTVKQNVDSGKSSNENKVTKNEIESGNNKAKKVIESQNSKTDNSVTKILGSGSSESKINDSSGSKKEVKNENSKTKSIFDDSSDSEIFNSNLNTDQNKIDESRNVVNKNKITKHEESTSKIITNQFEGRVGTKEVKSSLFDDDDDDIFKTDDKHSVNSNLESKLDNETVKNVSKLKDSNKSIFNDDSGDELFIKKEKVDVPKSKLLDDVDDLFENSPNFIEDKESEIKKSSIKTSTSTEVISSVGNKPTSESRETLDTLNEGETDRTNDVLNKDTKTANKVVIEEEIDNLFTNIIQDNEGSSDEWDSKVDSTSIEIRPNIVTNLEHNISKNVQKPKTQEKMDLNAELKNPILDNAIQDVLSNVENKTDFIKVGNPVKIQEKIDSNVDLIKPIPDLLDDTIQDVLFETKADFADVFSEPPEFEKTKEPKRSQNINALFDDDSDDEAFFKKNDPTLDDKPEISSSSENRLFGLFHDEPPDLDVDFIQKNKNKDQVDFNSALPKTKSEEKALLDETLFKIPKSQEKSVTEVVNERNTTNTSKPKNEDIESYRDEKTDNSKLKEDDSKSSKAVGKLKTMNFNINVNALLPGASPKKKVVEQTRSETDIRIKDSTNEVIQSKMVKSISFEGKPESSVLDNSLSKDRAKIQVKRRPSTRRARKEAVRKSAIDYDDSPDHSSSIDDVPKSSNSDNDINKSMDAKVETKFENEEDKHSKTNSNVQILEAEILKSCKVHADLDANLDSKVDTEVRTKTVYILNDEDIFNTEAKISDDFSETHSTLSKVSELSRLNTKGSEVKGNNFDSNEVVTTDNKDAIDNKLKDELFDDIDDLFKTKTNINTLGDVYKTIDSDNEPLFRRESVDKAKSIIDNSSFDDEELFKSDNTENAQIKSTAIDKKSYDNSLFKSHTSKTTTTAQSKVKSVIDNESDDEDLFKSKDNKIIDTSIDELFKHNTAKLDTKSITKPEVSDDIVDNGSSFNPITDTSIKTVKQLGAEDAKFDKSVENLFTKEEKTEETHNKVENTSVVDKNEISITKDDRGNANKKIQRNKGPVKVVKEIDTGGVTDELFRTQNLPNKNVSAVDDNENRDKIKSIQSTDHKTEARSKTKADSVTNVLARDESKVTHTGNKETIDEPKETVPQSKNTGTDNKETREKKAKPSLFDLSDEENELFNQSKTNKNVFDSDSDGELFSKRETVAKVVEKKERAHVDVKKSLFGDDDDDLFGVTKKSVEVQPSRSTVKEQTKSTEPVFEDPLSLFGDDDD